MWWQVLGFFSVYTSTSKLQGPFLKKFKNQIYSSSSHQFLSTARMISVVFSCLFATATQSSFMFSRRDHKCRRRLRPHTCRGLSVGMRRISEAFGRVGHHDEGWIYGAARSRFSVPTDKMSLWSCGPRDAGRSTLGGRELMLETEQTHQASLGQNVSLFRSLALILHWSFSFYLTPPPLILWTSPVFCKPSWCYSGKVRGRTDLVFHWLLFFWEQD